MIGFRGLKQITKHLFFLLQISGRCPSAKEEEEPSIYESAKEEVEEQAEGDEEEE